MNAADPESVQAHVITCLAEMGVPDASENTRISSLNLAWIIHRIEEANAREIELSDDQLEHARDVASLSAVLASVLESSQ